VPDPAGRHEGPDEQGHGGQEGGRDQRCAPVPDLIVCREETAAMRSQANTAKVLEGNPTLMRLRELEVLERVAASGKLNVVLGEKGLAERVVNLL